MKDPWSKSRVLVTGATGMVGAWLVKELLRRGAYVAALVMDGDPQSELYRSGDVQRTSVVNGRLEDFRTLERAVSLHEIDTVFHLGAQAIVGAAQRIPLATFEANIRGTYNLLEACRLHRDLVRRVVIASSDKAYGDQGKKPYEETMELRGRRPYEVSKSCADLLAQSYHHSYGSPVAIARCGNIYGGGDLNWSRIVPGTIRSLLRGERPLIRSNGAYVRDYFFVKDAVAAYLGLAENLADSRVRGECFNFGPKKPSTVTEIVAEIQRLMGTRLKPDIRDQVRGELVSQHVCSAKAEALLGWKTGYGLEQGLAETIAWYKDFLQGPLR